MANDFLVYHPTRVPSRLPENITVYHENSAGNEDPYLWNKNFLHTYCHITQFTNDVGQINFWISGNTWPNFTELYCDCVFKIAEKHYWTNANQISLNDKIVENEQTYEHHYKWGDSKYGQHQFKNRRRYTLKADSKLSFQPQDKNGNLIDILPFLEANGLSKETLRKGLYNNVGSKPFSISHDISKRLYDYLFTTASIRLTGDKLVGKHPGKQNLTSSNSDKHCPQCC